MNAPAIRFDLFNARFRLSPTIPSNVNVPRRQPEDASEVGNFMDERSEYNIDRESISTSPELNFLSVQQPWAWLIGTGRKTIETRTYLSKYRGQLVICAGKKPRDPWPNRISRSGPYRYGQTVCVCNMVDCRPLKPSDARAAGFDPSEDLDEDDCEGVWAWVLEDICPIDGIPIRGRVYLWRECNAPVSAALACLAL